MMKKVVLMVVAAVCLGSCYTPMVNQVHVYGVVEKVEMVRGNYKHKVWCERKGRYYVVVSDVRWEKGERIVIN